MDDEPSITTTLAMILEQKGYLVETANQAELVIPLLVAQPYDLVILDILMAGVNGLELLPKIRDCCPGVPIVMHSASVREEHEQLAFELGAIEFWRKPIDPDDLLKNVQELIG